MEKIIQYRIYGFNIICILHVPKKNPKMIGIILFCPGHQYRVGPHRMYVKLARKLESNGYHVLRVDDVGIGDSTGHFNDEYLYQVHGKIQRGKLVKTSKKIIRQFKREYKFNKIIVSGLCGGSHTGLLASKNFYDIDAVIGIGLPFFYTDVEDSSDTPLSRQKRISEKKRGFRKQEEIPNRTHPSLLRSYLRKVFSINSWKKFITFQSDYKLVARAGWIAFQRKVMKRNPRVIHKAVVALLDLLESDRKILIIYGEKDFHFSEYKIACENTAAVSEKLKSFSLQPHIIKNANHTFTMPEWENQMHEIIINFITSLAK